ncbi:cytochrome P450 4A12A-like [Mercenaria mercenaria]|uniref:cytochrome P450 4A12A-like n=1 Tax=Mercenaria mercenaria TaxID=6596 RepID=UPI00234F94F5|nr:cytochrome P450 4A12A-like [Mercenaria mercenaria]
MEVFHKLPLILHTILTILGIFVSYYVVLFFIHLRRIKRSFKGAKGPEKCHWLFGSFFTFPAESHKRLMYFVEMANTYGSKQGYVLLWGMFQKPIVVPCSPKVTMKICKSNEPKSKGLGGPYRFLQPWLGEGLLVANGEKWARNRRLLTPAFHFDILKPYTKVFNQSADTLVKKITTNVEAGERFEVFQNVCLCTLEIILKCAFSYSKDVQNAGYGSHMFDTCITISFVSFQNMFVISVLKSNHCFCLSPSYITKQSEWTNITLFLVSSLYFFELVVSNRNLNSITCSAYLFTRHPITFFDTVWNISSVGRQFRKDCEFVHSVAEEIIDKRRDTLEQTGKPMSSRYIDFLDILLTARDEEGRGLSRLEIRNEVDTFLFEGHDTTASAISWILYSLAENPECQRKCQAEIDEVLGDSETGDVEWSDLNQLEYLTMCIKEGMRLHAPVTGVARETEQDFDLGDRVAPKGTMFMISMNVLNHMENVWGSDHMEFKPERFSKENVDKIEHFQYVPFSAGPRNCIEQNFAMNEEKVVLSKLLRNFTFRLDPDHEVIKKVSGVMRTKDGMFMFAEKRKC